MQRLWYLASLATILSPASAQQRSIVPLQAPTPALTPPASALDVASQVPRFGVLKSGIDGGSPLAIPASLDDTLPPPIPARVKSTPAGDVVVAEASGDPYFLGFTAGAYYPPRGERIDPALLRNLKAAYTDGRPNQETFAFVMFEKRITDARVRALEQLGARVLEFHPYNCLKVALPIFSIEQIAASPDVHWIGVARPAQKVHPRLIEAIASARAGEAVPVYIDVFDSDLNGASTLESFGSVSQLSRGAIEAGDARSLPRRAQSNGWQQRALQQAGVEILEYVEQIHAFRARLLPLSLENVVGLDFVQFVESDEAPELHHDFSTPLIASDNTRQYYSGGTNAVVTAGQCDSGFDALHWDLNHTNAVGWDFSGSATGPWHDGCTHGSHVAGTITGNGNSGSYELKGNAPGLGWGGSGRYYNLKIFNDACGFNGTALSSMLGLLHTSYFDGGSTTQRPMVINNSWGTSAGVTPYNGTEADARLLDDEVYFNVQDYVFSTGNQGPGKVGLQAGSKNVLSVGNVQAYGSAGYGSIGDLASDSSYGPMGDARWKPNVVAPGVNIYSVSANTTTGHKYFSGTSMAAPHVSGTISQLLDNYSFLRYAPARTDCLVMASAVTHNNQVLTAPSDTHLMQFGTGRIDATKAMWGTGDSGWTNWGFFLSSNTYSYSDFTVSAGCTRLVVCMHYAESQASSGASVALKNNWDLYLDQAPIDPNFNTGDWFAQQSVRDNTEIRIIDNPQVGAWRWKVWPTSTTTGCDMGVTVYAYYATTTPDLTVTTTLSKNYARPGELVDFTGWVYNPVSLAAGVNISPDLNGVSPVDSLRSLADGTTAHFMDNYPSYGKDVTLGDMFPGTWKGNIWRVQYFSEGIKNLSVTSASDNSFNHVAYTQLVVDGTPPSDVTGLSSSTHAPFTWVKDPDIFTSWNAASDSLSGVAGYSVELSAGAPVFPDDIVETSATGFNFYGTASSPPGGYYVSVRSVDNSGNGSANLAAYGPIFLDADAPDAPTGLSSTSHTLGAGSCNPQISMQWNDGADAHSGVQGYAVQFDNAPGTDLTGAALVVFGLGNPSYSQNVGASPAPWYFHIATMDWAGNYSTTVTEGPYFTSAPPTTYCVPKLNALGCYPDIGSFGTASATATSGFTVVADNVRNNKPGLLLYSVTGADNQPFQNGTLCIQGPIKRSSAVNSGGGQSGNNCFGQYSLDMNSFASGLTGGSPHPALKIVGTHVWCQWWGRDPGFAPPNNSTLSNALAYMVCQ